MTRKQALTILGLTEGVDAEDIKRAYRKMAFALHPDLHPDNPAAGKDFQRLNEAYVFLTTPGASSNRQQRSAPRGQYSSAEAEAKEKARTDAERAYARAKKRFEEEAAKGGQAKPKAPPKQEQSAEKSRDMKRDEVLQDLLRDPFARRVFEDIYSQIREETARKQATARKKTAPKKLDDPGILERTVEGAQDWFRRQIDEEQTVRFAGPLVPGARVRLQIHHGLLGKSQTIELTLPPEFEPGRPLRLKGLGKRIGKWRGDLYLKIVN